MFNHLVAANEAMKENTKTSNWFFTVDYFNTGSFSDFMTKLDRELRNFLPDSADVKVESLSPTTAGLISADLDKGKSKHGETVHSLGEKIKELIRESLKCSKETPGAGSLACLETGELWDIKKTEEDSLWENLPAKKT